MNHLRRAEEVVGQRLAIRRGGIGGVMFLRQQPCGTDEVFIVVRQSGAVAVEPFAQFLQSRALRVLNRADGGHDGVFRSDKNEFIVTAYLFTVHRREDKLVSGGAGC